MTLHSLTGRIVPSLYLSSVRPFHFTSQLLTKMPSDDKKHHADGNDQDFTSRPATKRVRSDQDHSKGDVKKREDGQEDDKDGNEHKDEDWLSVPPFSVGMDKKGWETKWRESCWCGKSEFLTLTLSCWAGSSSEAWRPEILIADLKIFSGICIQLRSPRSQALPLRRLPAPARFVSPASRAAP